MDSPTVQPPPTLYLTKQPIYHCSNCQHEGVAERVTVTPWRWWHYLLALLFPLVTLFVYSNTAPIKRCANCHAIKIKRIRYEQLPKPPPLTDPNTLRNARHRKIAGWIIVALLAYRGIQAIASTSQPSAPATTNGNTQGASSQTQTNPQDVILKADQDEGYKAGYADGRARTGQIGDSYGPPATQERKAAYVRGYLAGYVVGCKEGGYDCTAVERAINEALNPGTSSEPRTQ